MNTKLWIGLIALATLSASAGTTVYSDTDFGSMASYNGTYVPGSPGYEHLSYSSAGDDAVVGVVGPLGTLDNLSMSFTYANLTSSGNDVPFAAFGVSVDGLWGGASAYRYDIISEELNQQLNGTSLVHVWDWTLNGGAGGDVAGLSNVTLDYVLGQADSYNGVAYGDLEVMRAYAYIGDEGASSGSADITSITVTSVPDGGMTVTLLGGALMSLAALRRKLFC